MPRREGRGHRQGPTADERMHSGGGLAIIDTTGLRGGFVGPSIFGLVERATGRGASGFMVIAITALLGLALIPALARALRAEAPSDESLALSRSDR